MEYKIGQEVVVFWSSAELGVLKGKIVEINPHGGPRFTVEFSDIEMKQTPEFTRRLGRRFWFGAHEIAGLAPKHDWEDILEFV